VKTNSTIMQFLKSDYRILRAMCPICRFCMKSLLDLWSI